MWKTAHPEQLERKVLRAYRVNRDRKARKVKRETKVTPERKVLRAYRVNKDRKDRKETPPPSWQVLESPKAATQSVSHSLPVCLMQ